MSDIIRERIRERLAITGMNPRTAALAAGLGPTYLYDFLKGKSNSISTARMAKLADILNTTPLFLSGETFTAETPTVPLSLPVLGTAAGSVIGAMELTSEVVSHFPMPPGLMGVRDAYGLYVTGESMAPLYKHGDPIFINPHQPERIGDVVVIQEERDGGRYAWVKELVKKDEDFIHTKQYNPDGDIKFKRKYVVAMHRVLTTAEILGL